MPKTLKIEPRPPKIDAKTVLKDVLKEDRVKNALGEASSKFFGSISSNLEPSWRQDGPMLEAKTEPKSIKTSMRKMMNF